MANTDDEMEDLPESVTQYYFVDDVEEPISFSVLPINWNSSETVQNAERQIYLRGNAGGGLDKIYKPVRAWRFDISVAKPEISVLSKENYWIKLQKPRQSYEKYISTVLITVNFLHVVKRNPEMNGKRVWKKLSEIFSLYDSVPSAKDLSHNRVLIELAVEHDESLKNSKCLMIFLERHPQKMNKAYEDIVKGKSDFVVSDDCSSDDLENDSGGEEDGSADENNLDDEEEDEDEPFDSVCSICDEGGSLLCCEGSCMRSFHATPRAGKLSKCKSLGFTEMEVQALPYFKCQNCQNKLHQCFYCGQLGSSDKQTGAKVFQCVNATCGYFYHPHCVAKRLHMNNEDAAKKAAEKILAGESFTCPLHTCFICKQAEDKTEPKLQMAVCRRCPKAYHRKCLPRKIAFEEDEDAGLEQRAWEGLLVDRILIYCLKHEILESLGTPPRDHIKFSDDVKKEKESSTGVLKEDKFAPKKKMPSLRAPPPAPACELKKKTVEDSNPDKKNDSRVHKLQINNSSRKLPSEKKSGLAKIESFTVEEHKDSKACLTEKLAGVELTETSKAKEKIQLDSDSERRIIDLMNEARSMVTLDDIIAKHEVLISSRSYKQKMDPCKGITRGKVEAFCEAVRAAIKKLDESSSIEDAKNICEPTIINQMVKWKSKLRVYLAPFLHGMRYTSFGRHFTKVGKLKEIADLIHWYANDGDTIVDFCCGANDFNWFVKQKLESRGKKCNYKSYDLFPPKNDFSFEARDWLKVQPSELPTGSNLIMGLNPPFGRKANEFIDKALQFKPKLIILIVPPETERLDKKQIAYDLIWEDKDKLSGKSFYLPGSVDIKDKQMEDWNIVAPVLYLWSRQDWTAKHKEIAKKHHHPLGDQRQNNPPNRLGRDSSFKNCSQTSVAMEMVSASPQTPPEDLKERAVGGNEDLDKKFTPKDHSVDKQLKPTPETSRNKKRNVKIMRHSEAINVTGGPAESSLEYKRRRSSPDKSHHEVPHHSFHNTRDGREPQNLRHHLESPSGFEPIHHDERGFSTENHSSRYYEPVQNEDICDPVHEYDQHRTVNYAPGNYGNFHPRDTMMTNHPQGNIYSSGIERRTEDLGPSPDYRPSDSILGYVRSDPRSYGINQSYGDAVDRYVVPTYRAEPAAYSGRVNPMSAMDKYNFQLGAPMRMGGAGYGHGPPNMGPQPTDPSFYLRHQAPRQEHPGVPRDFAPGPAVPFHQPPSSGGWIPN